MTVRVNPRAAAADNCSKKGNSGGVETKQLSKLPAHAARVCFSRMVRACRMNSKVSQRLTMQSRAEFRRLLQFCEVPVALYWQTKLYG